MNSKNFRHYVQAAELLKREERIPEKVRKRGEDVTKDSFTHFQNQAGSVAERLLKLGVACLQCGRNYPKVRNESCRRKVGGKN